MTNAEAFAGWLVERRKSLGMKRQKDLVRNSRLGDTLVWELENARGRPYHERTAGIRLTLAKTLQVDPDRLELFSRGVTGPPDEPLPSSISSIGLVRAIRRVPLYHGVSACRRDHREGVQVGDLPVDDDRAEFAVRLDGECMAPDYPPGSSAVFSRAEADAHGIVSGKDYLVWFHDGQVTFKRVVRAGDGLKLRCLNPDKTRFPDRPVSTSEIACVALCLSVSISKG